MCRPTTPCIEWGGRLDRDGYGVDERNRFVHRVAWEAANGPIPDSLEIDHLCSNRACRRLDHLEATTHLENIRRGEKTKLTLDVVREIRTRPRTLEEREEFAARLGVTAGQVTRICQRKTWPDEVGPGGIVLRAPRRRRSALVITRVAA